MDQKTLQSILQIGEHIAVEFMENASRASKQGAITPENLEPNPKNPIIASFFRTIGRADRLGSGVRNLYKYSKYYSGENPSFIEGDVFRIVVPLNDAYSFDFGLKVPIDNKSADKSADRVPIDNTKETLSDQHCLIMQYVNQNNKITSSKVEELLGVKQRRARIILNELVEKQLLKKQGSYKHTQYVLHAKEE